MTDINPDDLEIIKDILGNDEDDPIFGNTKNQSNNTKSSFASNNDTQPTQKSKISNQNSNDKNYNPIINFDPKKANIPNSKNGSPNTPIQKCTSVCLGGSDIPVGMTTETSGPHICSNLYCIKCDHNVLRFPDRKWKKSTDYLFLRNNFPENVHQNLIVSPGWCAYCCQCTFCEEQKLRKLPAFSSNWVCRGHR